MSNCIDCPEHEILPDPDPGDVKVLCKINGKEITCACRPYSTRKECETPDWCPKLKGVRQ